MVCMRASAFSLGTGPAVRSTQANEQGRDLSSSAPGFPSFNQGLPWSRSCQATGKYGCAPVLRLSILGDFGIRSGKLSLDIERRTALGDQHAVQRANVSALAVVLLKRSEALVGAAEPAGEGLHCRGGGRVPFGLGLGR